MITQFSAKTDKTMKTKTTFLLHFGVNKLELGLTDSNLSAFIVSGRERRQQFVFGGSAACGF